MNDQQTSGDIWRQRALTVMPGLQSNYGPSAITPPVIERAEGFRLYDSDGRMYLDFVLSMGPAIFGSADPGYRANLERQLARLYALGSATAFNPAEIELAERVVAHLPCAEKVRFAISGSEANQLAFRLARAFTGRPLIVRFVGHYHGWLDNVFAGELAPHWRQNLAETPPYAVPSPGDSAGMEPGAFADFLVIPWNDAEALEALLAAHGARIAMVHMEAWMCNFGCCPPRSGYLAKVRALCDRFGVLLCFDEVITGFRVALGGAQALTGVTPDLAILGKALGGGLPIGAVAGRADILDQLKDHRVKAIGTFNSVPLAAAAGVYTLDRLADPAKDHFAMTAANTAQVAECIRAAAHAHGHREILIQGPPGMLYVDFIAADVAWTPEDLAPADATTRERWRRLLLEEGVMIGGRSRLVIAADLTSDDLALFDQRVQAAFARL